jgi:hypothetical protein
LLLPEFFNSIGKIGFRQEGQKKWFASFARPRTAADPAGVALLPRCPYRRVHGDAPLQCSLSFAQDTFARVFSAHCSICGNVELSASPAITPPAFAPLWRTAVPAAASLSLNFSQFSHSTKFEGTVQIAS